MGHIEWLLIDGSTPHAMHVLATYFDNEAGEWVMSVEASPPASPFTHWAEINPPGDVEKGIPIKRTGVEPFDKSSLYLGKDGE